MTERHILLRAIDALAVIGIDLLMAAAVLVALLGAINWLEYGW